MNNFEQIKKTIDAQKFQLYSISESVAFLFWSPASISESVATSVSSPVSISESVAKSVSIPASISESVAIFFVNFRHHIL